MISASVRHIEVHFPSGKLDNRMLAEQFAGWTPEKIEEKTGIRERRIAQEGELSSDLAVAAATKLLDSGVVRREDVDFLLLCTQSPDYFLPTTACLVQDRLGLPTTCGALDFNLGCSGYIYGLGLAKGLIESGQAKNVMLVTAETYSKFIHPRDKSVRTIFGDAAAATLVQGVESAEPHLGPFVYGTDGRGAPNLIVPTSGMRRPRVPDAAEETDQSGNVRTCNDLYMNGAEIFSFTIRAVPEVVAETLRRAGFDLGDIDHFVFHQANQYMLEFLRKKIHIPKDRFVFAMAEWGNTVSSTIPIALAQLIRDQSLADGQKLLLVGFGVGYSWGATIIRYRA